ncbi:hypothetical protein BVC80_897g29 [Macleaya cordata]|uniref:Uncharacterized protein n=1 Tax=Macleaya cordata TaxID=56857 RepID=A0A200QFW6_MACCD|nr:hypothetical protein BVC80_897g29 [Macleaya cordata]
MAARPLRFIISHHQLPFFRSSNPLNHPSYLPDKRSKEVGFLGFRTIVCGVPLKHPEQRQQANLRRPISPTENLAQRIGKSIRRPGATSKARVYADVNVVRPKDYWDYETLTVQWG